MKKIQVGKFEICIGSHTEDMGYFEHDVYGDELGGGLWFEGKKLVDYDGVYSLPDEVIEGLEKLGYDASYAKGGE